MRRSILVSLLGATVACSDPAPAAEPVTERPSPGARDDTPPGLVPSRRLAAALPDRLGAFTAVGEAEHTTEVEPATTTRALRRYRDGERAAILRVIDAGRTPDLVIGFAAAQQIALPSLPGDGELIAIGIAGRPGLASWDPVRTASEAQVLVRSRLIVSLSIAPAMPPEESVDLLETLPFAELEALLR